MSSTSAPFTLDRRIVNPDLYDRVQRTWFAGQPVGQKVPSEDSFKRWFNNPNKEEAAAFDQQLSDDFLPALKTLFPDHFTVPPATTWAEEQRQASTLAAPFMADVTPASDSSADIETASTNALGLVLLLDQIPRNTLRKQQKIVFTHTDRLARAVVHTLLSSPQRPDHAPGISDFVAKRMRFYLPLMHSEHIEDHHMFTKNQEELQRDQGEDADEATTKLIKGMVGFEEKHAVIIRHFGRYPYRNDAVGRETTKEEQEWLDGGGERFGA